jgi:hypothetical protein
MIDNALIDFELPSVDFTPRAFDFAPDEHGDDVTAKVVYGEPRPWRRVALRPSNADELIHAVAAMPKSSGMFAFVNGGFVFGDFICRMIETLNIHVLRMMVSTLSISQENIDYLAALKDREFIDDLSICMSSYFWGHERRGLIPYMAEALDREPGKFRLAVSAVHTKIVLMETEGGRKLVFHGSANFRSSNNVEHVSIDEDGELFGFVWDYHNRIFDRYAVTRKPVWERSFFNQGG